MAAKKTRGRKKAGTKKMTEKERIEALRSGGLVLRRTAGGRGKGRPGATARDTGRGRRRTSGGVGGGARRRR